MAKPVPENWPSLLLMTRAELRALGCAAWSDDEQWQGESRLMLFPAEWYQSIPCGFPLVCIDGEREKFKPGKTDNDQRGGYLAFGVLCSLVPGAFA